jgi:hypothetical protein
MIERALQWIVAASAALLVCACGGGAEDQASSGAASPAPAEQRAAARVASSDCPPTGDVSYVCGPRNAEDLVRIGSSEWLIASGMSALQGPATPGNLYLVNHETKEFEPWFPGLAPKFALDESLFGACPGPINLQNFSAHGLALRERGAGQYRLFMTSHGEREAIEVFDVDASGERPTIVWAGCVVLPERTFANSVAILDDGGLVTTKMMDPTAPDAFAAVLSGQITGHVYEWHPGQPVTAVAGTELAGPNGIEVSPDQRWMFVTAIGSREVVRFDRQTSPPEKTVVAVDVSPDNLRWTAAGTLFTVGGNYVPPTECASPPCAAGWSVVEIDPQTMQATRVAGADQTAALQGASTALEVDDEIWIGTFSGDRIAYLRNPD